MDVFMILPTKEQNSSETNKSVSVFGFRKIFGATVLYFIHTFAFLTDYVDIFAALS